jgi:5-methylcytosine-specific restriction endonuclease McrA
MTTVYAPQINKRGPRWMARATQIADRDGGWHCHYCNRERKPWQLTFDHMKPKCKGGTTALDNLVLACTYCNNRKGDQDYEEFMASGEWHPPRWIKGECCQHLPSVHRLKAEGGGCRLDICDCPAYYH